MADMDNCALGYNVDVKADRYNAENAYEEESRKLDVLFDSLAKMGEYMGRFTSDKEIPEYRKFLERFSIFILGETNHYNAIRMRHEKEKNFFSSKRVLKSIYDEKDFLDGNEDEDKKMTSGYQVRKGKSVLSDFS